jgi:hypothetical protein
MARKCASGILETHSKQQAGLDDLRIQSGLLFPAYTLAR